MVTDLIAGRVQFAFDSSSFPSSRMSQGAGCARHRGQQPRNGRPGAEVPSVAESASPTSSP